MLAVNYGRMYDLGRDFLDDLLVGVKAHRRTRQMSGNLRDARLRNLEQARSEAADMSPVNPGSLAALHEARVDALLETEARAHYQKALELVQGICPPGNCRSDPDQNIAELYKKLGDIRRAMGYLMKPEDGQSGKWHNRFFRWFLQRFSGSGRKTLLRDRVLEAVGQMLAVVMIQPLLIVFLAAELLLLRYTIREAGGFLAGKREDQRDLVESGAGR